MGKLGQGIMVDLDKPRRLVLDLNAMCEWETATGKSLAQIGKTASVKDIRLLLWAMLRADDPELTLEQAGALVTLDRLPEISAALSQAVNAAMPAPKPGNGAGDADSPLPPAGQPIG